GDRVDGASVALEGSLLLARLDVEDADRAARVADDERFAVAREGEVDRLGARELSHLARALALPEPHAVLPGARDELRVGRERDAGHVVAVAIEPRDLLPRARGREDDAPVPARRGDPLAVGREGDGRDLGVVAVELERLAARRGLE